MLQKKDLLILPILALIALAVAVAVFVAMSPDKVEPVVRVTAAPTAPSTATPTATQTATPTFTPAPTDTPQPTPVPSFGPITFGTGVRGEVPLNAGVTFPAGTTVVYAVWAYQNMAHGTPCRLSWYLDDTPWSFEPLVWNSDQYGSEGAAYVTQVDQYDTDGLPPGHYRLELFIGERQVQIATFAVLGPTPTALPPTPTPQPDFQAMGRSASRSLVEIWVPGDYFEGSSGSGSIVDGEKGLILTNWHVVTDDWGDLMNAEGLAIILLTVDPDREPAPSYVAQILPEYSDPYLDLVILQITYQIEGESPVPVQWPLNLPAIPLGDSNTVSLGDRVLLLGYPDYAEGRLSWTEGIVASHNDEWIKTSAAASYGHSGGMMLDRDGQLVGVITALQQTGREQEISAARPINAAESLIQGALSWTDEPSQETEPPWVEETPEEYLVVLGAEELNLRDKPSLHSKILDKLPLGAVVKVLQGPEWDGERSWYYVQDLDTTRTGWASGVYLASWDVAASPILFTSDRTGSEDIYSILPNGTGLVQLTDTPGNAGDASWSPDGNYIVFTYEQDGNSSLYIMDAYGEEWSPLTWGEAHDVHPVWSPDGGRIAFVSNRDGDWEIYLLDLYAEETRQLTFNQDWDSFPTWSPDSSHLVFTSLQTRNYDLFLVDVETGLEIQLTTNPYSDAHASWSPQGDEIAYTMVMGEGDTLYREIGILNVLDPAHPWQVTASAADEPLHQYPDWSPDGRWLVFTSQRDGNDELYIIPARGGPPHRLTTAPASAETAPSWSR